MRFPLSYSYDGPKRIGWSYDPNGNVTSDATNGVSIDWNVIDLPRAITSGTSSTQRFYLADGTLSHIQDGTQMRIFLGDIVFKISPGSFGIESAGWEGGRLLPGTGNDKVLYYVNDHLGSVRVIKNGNGSIKQRFDYYPYGSVSRGWWGELGADNPEKRYRFGGKEIAGTASNATATGSDTYLDFGARLYNPRTALWMSQDPMAEDYYHFTPYLYCAGNPVNVVDPEGSSIWIYSNSEGVLVQYSNGVLYYEDGREYDGADGLVWLVANNLNELFQLNDPKINEIITTLDKSTQKHIFVFDMLYDDGVSARGEYGESLANEGKAVGTWIKLSLKNRPTDDVYSSHITTIGHELRHSYDYDQKLMKGLIPWENHPSNNPTEIRAVNFENRIRYRTNKPLRYMYGKRKIDKALWENPKK